MDIFSFVIAAIIVAASIGLEIKREIDIRRGVYKDKDDYRLSGLLKKKLSDRKNCTHEEETKNTDGEK